MSLKLDIKFITCVWDINFPEPILKEARHGSSQYLRGRSKWIFEFKFQNSQGQREALSPKANKQKKQNKKTNTIRNIGKNKV